MLSLLCVVVRCCSLFVVGRSLLLRCFGFCWLCSLLMFVLIVFVAIAVGCTFGVASVFCGL